MHPFYICAVLRTASGRNLNDSACRHGGLGCNPVDAGLQEPCPLRILRYPRLCGTAASVRGAIRLGAKSRCR
jgi:hypothetical protein